MRLIHRWPFMYALMVGKSSLVGEMTATCGTGNITLLECFSRHGELRELGRKLEVFTLLHEFLRIPPDSQWKVGILRNSMEFLWKAFGWSLSHLGFHFHGNSHFFPRNSNGNGQNPGASGNDSQWNPMDSIGIPLKFHWNSVGNSFIVIVKNSIIVKN